jgi:hypothetical protein
MQQPKSGIGRLIVEVSRSRTQLDNTHPAELLWMSDQLVAEVATYTTHNKHKDYLYELYGLICHKL